MFLSEWLEFPSAPCMCSVYFRGADKSLAWPGRKQANVSVRMAWISFSALPCRKKELMTARVSMLLKSRASLKCFRTCFFPVALKSYQHPGMSCVFPEDDQVWSKRVVKNTKFWKQKKVWVLVTVIRLSSDTVITRSAESEHSSVR